VWWCVLRASQVEVVAVSQVEVVAVSQVEEVVVDGSCKGAQRQSGGRESSLAFVAVREGVWWYVIG
jgi:hypothetical protein